MPGQNRRPGQKRKGGGLCRQGFLKNERSSEVRARALTKRLRCERERRNTLREGSYSRPSHSEAKKKERCSNKGHLLSGWEVCTKGCVSGGGTVLSAGGEAGGKGSS